MLRAGLWRAADIAHVWRVTHVLGRKMRGPSYGIAFALVPVTRRAFEGEVNRTTSAITDIVSWLLACSGCRACSMYDTCYRAQDA